jgi:hypothetical protein
MLLVYSGREGVFPEPEALLMVDVIDSWKVLRDHIANHPNALVLYKVDDVGGEARLRIMAGSLGIDKTFSAKDDDFDQILRFMEEINAVVVKKQLPDDYFFM